MVWKSKSDSPYIHGDIERERNSSGEKKELLSFKVGLSLSFRHHLSLLLLFNLFLSSLSENRLCVDDLAYSLSLCL